MMNDRFIIDTNFLIKAEENEKGEKFVYFHASSEQKDSQEETVLQKALRESADYFLAEGVISYDHLHKSVNDDGRIEIRPEYIIGEPVDVKFSDDEYKNTFVKARLYVSDDAKSSLANEIWRMAKSGSTRLRASVGGRILRRNANNSDIIEKVIWDDLCATVKPVNKSLSGVSVYPLEEFAKSFSATTNRRKYKAEEYGYDLNNPIDRMCWESLNKALETTSTDTATAYTGGRALQTGGGDDTRKEEISEIMKSLVNDIKNGDIKSVEDIKSKLGSFDDDIKISIMNKIKSYLYKARKN